MTTEEARPRPASAGTPARALVTRYVGPDLGSGDRRRFMIHFGVQSVYGLDANDARGLAVVLTELVLLPEDPDADAEP